MRQTIIKIIVLLGVWVCGALPALCDDAVQMVTYFPAPYAKYNNLHISNKFDVGTNDDSFTLELGNPDSANASLEVNSSYDSNVVLKNVNDNALVLDMDVFTWQAGFGNFGVEDEEADPAKLTFEKNLRMKEFLSTNLIKINSSYLPKQYLQSIKADDMQIDGDMFWFLDKFGTKPVNSKLPGCAYTVHWKKISLNKNPAKDAWFLVCEEDEQSGGGNCSDSTYKNAHKQECCPSTSTDDTDCWQKGSGTYYRFCPGCTNRTQNTSFDQFDCNNNIHCPSYDNGTNLTGQTCYPTSDPVLKDQTYCHSQTTGTCKVVAQTYFACEGSYIPNGWEGSSQGTWQGNMPAGPMPVPN